MVSEMELQQHSQSILFRPVNLGSIELRNRVVMAPMTRSQADLTVPSPAMARHYGARAAAGLIVTEGTSPSVNGLTDSCMPGIFDDAHVTGWKKVTRNVHRNGGRMFLQLMHCGRVSHPTLMPETARLLAPSAVALDQSVWIDEDEGEVPYPVPQEMDQTDIERTIEEFAHASELAINAEFDGVEIHAANGYLVDQFLNLNSNRRDDKWGGSVVNRNRFAIQVVDAVAKRVGNERVGIRISPYSTYNGMGPDSEMEELYSELAGEMGKRKIAYLHVILQRRDVSLADQSRLLATIRDRFDGTIILAGNFDKSTAIRELESGNANLIAFGRPFISNPDLIEKLKTDSPLNDPNFDEY